MSIKNKLFIALLINIYLSLGISIPIDCSPTSNQTRLLQSIKWYRDSAEKNAIYNQTYTLATRYLLNWVKISQPKRNTWGAVLDIDETSLDNSWYFIKCSDIADNESDFEHYVTIKDKSVALPGVVKFTHQVHELGGYVTMISNRDGSYKDNTGNAFDATVKNLKEQNIYFDQVILSNYSKSHNPTDKNKRFNATITGNYDSASMVWDIKLPAHKVIIYVGDNIQDFPRFKQSTALNNSNLEQYNKFGQGYFILPNPIYGSWESNAYK